MFSSLVRSKTNLNYDNLLLDSSEILLGWQLDLKGWRPGLGRCRKAALDGHRYGQWPCNTRADWVSLNEQAKAYWGITQRTGGALNHWPCLRWCLCLNIMNHYLLTTVDLSQAIFRTPHTFQGRSMVFGGLGGGRDVLRSRCCGATVSIPRRNRIGTSVGMWTANHVLV